MNAIFLLCFAVSFARILEVTEPGRILDVTPFSVEKDLWFNESTETCLKPQDPVNFPPTESTDQVGFDEIQKVFIGSSSEEAVIFADVLSDHEVFVRQRITNKCLSSHMIFLNPPRCDLQLDPTCQLTSSLNVTWTFDSAVYAVMRDPNGVDEFNSNFLFAHPNVIYPEPFFSRGMEIDFSKIGLGGEIPPLTEPRDRTVVGPAGFLANQLRVSMVAGCAPDDGDWIRVLTLHQDNECEITTPTTQPILTPSLTPEIVCPPCPRCQVCQRCPSPEIVCPECPDCPRCDDCRCPKCKPRRNCPPCPIQTRTFTPSPIKNYHWVYGQFQACSVTCGSGVQERTATCEDSQGNIVDDSFCPGTPITTQTCNTQPCTAPITGNICEQCPLDVANVRDYDCWAINAVGGLICYLADESGVCPHGTNPCNWES